jgi:hypothetical protein
MTTETNHVPRGRRMTRQGKTWSMTLAGSFAR